MTDSTQKPAKPLAKSLHTVTVLVRVAALHRYNSTATIHAEEAVDRALNTLGYAGAEDPQGLRAAAIKQCAAQFGGI